MKVFICAAFSLALVACSQPLKSADAPVSAPHDATYGSCREGVCAEGHCFSFVVGDEIRCYQTEKQGCEAAGCPWQTCTYPEMEPFKPECL